MPNDDLNITNQATAQIKLTIDNDKKLLQSAIEMAWDSGDNESEYSQDNLALALERVYSDDIALDCQVQNDLLQLIVNFVDWHDLASHYIEKAISATK